MTAAERAELDQAAAARAAEHHEERKAAVSLELQLLATRRELEVSESATLAFFRAYLTDVKPPQNWVAYAASLPRDLPHVPPAAEVLAATQVALEAREAALDEAAAALATLVHALPDCPRKDQAKAAIAAIATARAVKP